MVSIASLDKKNDRIAVIGLGYVGLPLAVHLAKHFDVVGFDTKHDRIRELRSGIDRTGEVDGRMLKNTRIELTDEQNRLSMCGLFIVAVPTPIDNNRIPDLNPLEAAAKIVGQNLTEGACVVFESTVFPGATEEVCVPILETESGLTRNVDFTVGYSPERINPGDKTHTLDTIIKIVSGSTKQTVDFLEQVYGRVVPAGIYKASSIKVAEAAKVIENTQRVLNIALMNELSMIFNKMGIDTKEVLAAAGTKWNFMPFTPGLVGGHCIGVDPYYLTFKAEALGYHPEMILAGCRINAGMGKYVAEQTVKLLMGKGRKARGAKAALLGITFKENVPDLRNTRAVDIFHELTNHGVDVVVSDPVADPGEAWSYLGINIIPWESLPKVDTVILAVPHQEYLTSGISAFEKLRRGNGLVFVDVKGAFSKKDADGNQMIYWRL